MQNAACYMYLKYGQENQELYYLVSVITPCLKCPLHDHEVEVLYFATLARLQQVRIANLTRDRVSHPQDQVTV